MTPRHVSIRFGWGALRWVLAVAAVVLIAIGLVRTRIDTSVTSFVPHGDASYSQLTAHDEAFGGEPIVVVLHGATADGVFLDPTELVKLIQLEGALSALPEVKVVYGPGTVLNQTGLAIKDVLAQIAGRRDSLCNLAKVHARSRHATKAEQQAACDRAVGAIDVRYGQLLVKAMPVGLPSVSNQKFVASVLFDHKGDPKPEWRFLAPDAKSATVLVRPDAGLSQAATARLVDAVRTTVADADLQTSTPLITGVPVLTSAMADKAGREASLLGGAALIGVGLVFFLIPWSRRKRARLLPLSAAVLGTATTVAIFGWLDRPLSLGVVAFMPILLGIGSDFPLYLAQPARRRRVLAAAAAAAAGFASLTLTPLPFVREFGIALALGVAVTVGWALALRGLFHEVEPHPAAVRPRRSLTGWQVVTVRGTASVLVVVAIAGWVLLDSVRIQSSTEQLASGLPELASITQAERTLGFAGEIDIEISGNDVLSDEVLAWERQAESVLVRAYGDQMRPLLTYGRLLSFLGAHPTSDQLVAGSSLIPAYLLSAIVGEDNATATSTFGIRSQDVREQARLIDAIQRALPPAPDGYTVSVTGLPVLAAHGLTTMSSTRYLINLVGILVAGLVLLLVLRSWRDPLAAVATALLAAGWLFAAVSALGVALSPLTIAVGALVTVTSCEFSTMLSARDQSWTRRSVAVAACAGTVGYAALALSDLAVLRDFGITLAAGVVCSYLAARLVRGVLDTFGPTLAEARSGTAEHTESPSLPATPVLEAISR